MSPDTVHSWVQRANSPRLDRVDWYDQSRAPRHPHRTEAAIAEPIPTGRRVLEQSSALGFHGAEAIPQVLSARQVEGLPTVRTIGRILRRGGVLDGQARGRRRPPPSGWDLPEGAARRRELDCFDVVARRVLPDGPQVEVLNGLTLHGGRAVSGPRGSSLTARFVVECLIGHWKAVGRPSSCQFDHDTIFPGPQAPPDTLGRVTRRCLSLGVVPVVVPPRAPGFQAIIEGSNGTWPAKLWARFEHVDLSDREGPSSRFVAAHRRHRADRIESAPRRRAFPEGWKWNLQARPGGRIVSIRRTDTSGVVALRNRRFEGDRQWLNRLVRAEVDLDGAGVRFYRLRRGSPPTSPCSSR